MIHRELCGVNGLDRADKWYERQHQSVLETDKCCGTSTYIVTTRPNTVVVGEEDTVCKIIDVAVLADCRVNSKESEKWL